MDRAKLLKFGPPIVAVLGLIILMIAGSHPRARQTTATHTATTRRAPTPPPAIAAAARPVMDQYVKYLNGAPANILGPLAKQAGGRLGANANLQVLSTQISRWSPGANTATVTGTLTGNGNQSIPFDVTVARKAPGRWVPTGITPPDPTEVSPPHMTPAPSVPSDGQAQIKQFIEQYAAYAQAGYGGPAPGVSAASVPAPAGMSQQCGGQIAQNQDPLYGQTVPSGKPKIVSAQFGPPNSDQEVAVQAIVMFGGQDPTTVSVTMKKQEGRWTCFSF